MDASLRCASFSMTDLMPFQALFLRHSKCFFPVIPSTFFCHSKRQRGIQRDVDASLCSAWLGQGWQPLVPLLAKGEGRLPTADRVRLSSPLFQRQE